MLETGGEVLETGGEVLETGGEVVVSGGAEVVEPATEQNDLIKKLLTVRERAFRKTFSMHKKAERVV